MVSEILSFYNTYEKTFFSLSSNYAITNNVTLSGRYGTWSICFTYGTMFAIKGLVAAGSTYDTSSCIRKACKFLLSKQQITGGWGESYLSSETEVNFLLYLPRCLCFGFEKGNQVHLVRL